MNNVKGYKNVDGKTVGFMGEDNIYKRVADSRKHLHLKMDAWGMDADIFTKIREDGCEEVKIKDYNGDIYSVSISLFESKQIKRNFGNPQVFLPRKYWTLTKNSNETK